MERTTMTTSDSSNLSKLQSNYPVTRSARDRINSIFDCADLIARRSGSFIAECEPVALRLFLLFHLLVDLALVLWFLLSR